MMEKYFEEIDGYISASTNAVLSDIMEDMISLMSSS
jgi:hypothetical protein